MSGPPKAIQLVSIVVARRKILDAILDCRIGNSIPVLDARGAEVDVIPRVGFLGADVMCDAKAEFVCFVFYGRHEIAIDAEDFDSVHAHFFEIANSLSRSLSRGGHWRIAVSPVHEYSRAWNFSARASSAEIDDR